MFVFLALPNPNDRLTGFVKAMKTSPAAKLYWRPLNRREALLSCGLLISIFRV